MCGRYTRHTPPDIFAELFRARLGAVEARCSYNIVPSSPVLACRQTGDGRELTTLRWGLVPSWAKDAKIGYKMANARAETVAEKPAYRAAFKRRRCLIAADGFYEWKPGAPRKQPYYFQLDGGAPFGFAGLWEHWQQGDQVIESCTIIVTSANALVGQVHDRMPVILAPEQYDLWLDPAEQDPPRLLPLLGQYPEQRMSLRAVNLRVNNPKNDDPALISGL